METLEAICKRCSLKTQLSGTAIEPEKINTILDAGHLAPSARNMQPWRFVVVQEGKAIEELVDGAFFEPNAMAKQAPVILVVCARPDDDVVIDGKEYYLFDVGLAVGNVLLAATDLGLVTHPMAAFNESEVKRILHIPDDYRVVIVTPLAYPLADCYEEAARERLSQRTRKDLPEIAFFNSWCKAESAG